VLVAALKVLLPCQALQEVLNGVVVLVVEVERERQLAIEAAVDLFMVAVVAVVVAQLHLVLLNAGLVAEFQRIQQIRLTTPQIRLV
jgi:hypothetical protein